MHPPRHTARQLSRLNEAMARTNTVRLLPILCIGLAGTSGGQAALESHEKFVCTSGTTQRIVRIYNHAAPDGKRSSDGICRVDYTKDGRTRTLWTSSTGHAYCTTKALSLVTKLIQDKYTCKPESVDADRS